MDDWRVSFYRRYPVFVGFFGLPPYVPRYKKHVVIWQSWYEIQDGIRLPLN